MREPAARLSVRKIQPKPSRPRNQSRCVNCKEWIDTVVLRTTYPNTEVGDADAFSAIRMWVELRIQVDVLEAEDGQETGKADEFSTSTNIAQGKHPNSAENPSEFSPDALKKMTNGKRLTTLQPM